MVYHVFLRKVNQNEAIRCTNSKANWFLQRWNDNAPADNPNKQMVPTGKKTASFAMEPGFFGFDDLDD